MAQNITISTETCRWPIRSAPLKAVQLFKLLLTRDDEILMRKQVSEVTVEAGAEVKLLDGFCIQGNKTQINLLTPTHAHTQVCHLHTSSLTNCSSVEPFTTGSSTPLGAVLTDCIYPNHIHLHAVSVNKSAVSENNMYQERLQLGWNGSGTDQDWLMFSGMNDDPGLIQDRLLPYQIDRITQTYHVQAMFNSKLIDYRPVPQLCCD